MKKIIRNPKGNPATLRHDSEATSTAAKAGAPKSAARLRLRWQAEPEKMKEVARRASAAVERGAQHPNAKSYTIYRPDDQPPIRGVKNLSLWVRENQMLLGYQCRAESCHGGMVGPSGWRGWKAVREQNSN